MKLIEAVPFNQPVSLRTELGGAGAAAGREIIETSDRLLRLPQSTPGKSFGSAPYARTAEGTAHSTTDSDARWALRILAAKKRILRDYKYSSIRKYKYMN